MGRGSENIVPSNLKKGISITLVFLLVMSAFAGLLPFASMNVQAGNTWVVKSGGGAGVDYFTIQSAINGAIAGDTIIVLNGGTPYNENLIVDKSITIIGESPLNTTVNGGGTDAVITIQTGTDNVIISGLRICHYGAHGGNDGISIFQADYATIENCIINNSNQLKD